MRSKNEKDTLRRLAQIAIATAVVAFVIYQWQMRPPPGTQARTFDHGGRQRTYLLHPAPTGLERALLVVLHGSGGRGRMVERRTGFDAIAERAGVVVAYPDGVDAVWNDGWRPASVVDDVGFLSALVDSLVAEFDIDPARVYATGFSNGGGMVHRLACESTRFAAIAPVAGYMPARIAERCRGGPPVSVLAVHGTDDAVVPYDQQLTGILEHWVARDGCTAPAESVRWPDRDPGDDTLVRIDQHTRCRAGSRVVLYSIEGGGHTWPGEAPDFWRRPGRVSHELDASAIILDFFLKAPEPVAP